MRLLLKIMIGIFKLPLYRYESLQYLEIVGRTREVLGLNRRKASVRTQVYLEESAKEQLQYVVSAKILFLDLFNFLLFSVFEIKHSTFMRKMKY